MIGDVLVRVDADVSRLERNMTRAQSRIGAFAGAAGAMSANFGRAIGGISENAGVLDTRLRRNQASMKTLWTITATGALSAAGAFGGFAVAAGVGLGAVVNEARLFEDAFTGVRKTTDATEEQFATLSRGLRRMSLEMPVSAVEIANVAEVAGQLGIKVGDIEEFTRTMVKMGVATNMSSTEAATSMARFMNIMGTSVSDVERLGSTIVDLGNNLATSETEIVNMSLRLAGAGRQIGLTEAEVLSFAGALSSVGIRAEAGGSAFSRVFLNMNEAVQSGSGELVGFAKTAGMSASDFKQAFENDAAGAVMAFISGLGDIMDSGGNAAAVLDDLGLSEIRVRDALLRAAGASDDFSEALKIGSEAWEENIALNEEAQERFDTFTSKAKILINHIKFLASTIGSFALNVLSGLIDAIMPTIGALVDWADSLEDASERTQNIIGIIMIAIPTFLGLTAAVFAVAGAVLLVMSGLATLAMTLDITMGAAALLALKVLGLSAAFVGVVAAVIAAAVAIAIYWEEITDAISRGVTAVVDYLTWFKDVVTDSSLSVGEKFDILTGDIRSSFATMVEYVAEGVKEVGEKLLDMIPAPVLDAIHTGMEIIGDTFSRAFETVKEIVQGDTEAITDFFVDLIPTIIGLLLGGIPGILIAVASWIPNIAEQLEMSSAELIDTGLGAVLRFIEGLLEGAIELIEVGLVIVENLLMGIAEALPIVIETALEIIMAIIEAISEYLPIIADVGSDIVAAIMLGLSEALPVLVEALVDILLAIVDLIVEFLPSMIDLGMGIISNLIIGIVELIPDLVDVIITGVLGMIDAIIELLPILIDAGMEIIFALLDGLIDALPVLIDSVDGIIDALTDAVVVAAPKLVVAGVVLIGRLAWGIIKSLPDVLDAIDRLLLALLNAVLKFVVKLVVAGGKLILGLVKGVLSMLGTLLSAGEELLIKLLQTIVGFFGDLFKAGAELFTRLIDGIKTKYEPTISSAKELVTGAVTAVKGFVTDFISAGKDLIGGLISGIKEKAVDLVDSAKGVVGDAIDGAKRLLRIGSPSKVFIGFGRDTVAGFVIGIEDRLKNVRRATRELVAEATPKQPAVLEFDVRGAQLQARGVSRKLQAEVNRGEFEHDRENNDLLGEIRDELRKQKEMIVELDGREVGRGVEEYVSEAGVRRHRRRDRAKGVMV